MDGDLHGSSPLEMYEYSIHGCMSNASSSPPCHELGSSGCLVVSSDATPVEQVKRHISYLADNQQIVDT